MLCSKMENSTAANWTIRAARPADYRALRILLPQAVHFASPATALVAEESGSARIIAAAAMTLRLGAEGLWGARVAVHVIPPRRRQGIATALLDTIQELVRPRGAQALFAWEPIPAESQELAAWRMLGFNRVSVTHLDVAQLPRAEAYLRPLYEQVVERQWIPPDAKLLPLAMANLSQVAVLHARYLARTAQQVLWRLSGNGVVPIDMQLSPVLVIDRQVRAFTLVRLEGNVCHVEATVVDPALRMGWANLWLKYIGIRWAIDGGAGTMIFYTHTRHSDTRKLARQFGAVTKELIEPYRLLF